MKNVFKHLKKSIIPIIIVLVLLVLQAQGDLALPEYISNIVDVGIQQGGIENLAPSEVRKTQFENILLFMEEDEISYVEGFYSENPDNADTLILKEKITKEDLAELDRILGLPILAVYGIEGGFSEAETDIDVESAMEIDPSTFSPETWAALSQLPEDANFCEVMKVLPTEEREKIVANMRESFAAYTELGDSIISQAGNAWVRNEYEALGIDTAKLQSQYIWASGLTMLAFALLIAAATVLTSLFSSRIGAKFAADLRGDIFHKVVGFSNKEYNQFSTASLITRCTNDINQIQMLITMVLRMVIYAPILGFGALFKVMGQEGNMTWIIGLAVGIIISIIIVLLIVAMPKFTILQKLIDKLNLVAREILTGLPVIRAFSREKHEEDRFDKANEKLMKTQLFVNRTMSIMMPAMMFLMNGICVLIIWVGAKQIDMGAIQVGNLMALIQYTMQIIMSFLMLSMMSIILPRSLVSVRRVADVLNTEGSVLDPETSEEFNPDMKGVVEFKNVSFRYPGADENVLENINFTALPGQTTAFIGSTGSGKSTLINLVPRFFDVTEGQILVDGVDVRNVTKHDLRKIIGYVPQKGQLFSGTIESNIGYGLDEIDSEQVKFAAEIAQAKDFIDEKPDGYDSEISQGGTNVSGGQRQRLSIARAIAKKPEIYIFDDSFSALDFKTDANLRKALNKATGDSTVLVVAQRISTVLNAEKIIVLDEGKVVDMGTHKELIERSEVYRQIASSQLTGEEMGA